MKKFFNIACILLLLSSVAIADYIAPGDVKIKTIKYKPQDTNFALGKYEYQVSWQGLPVAKASILVQEKNNSHLNVEASAQTGDVISLFYKLRFKSESTFKSRSLKPIHFESFQNENSKEKIRKISFANNGVIKTEYIKNGNHQESTEFKSNNATFDPISAAFLARSLPVEVGVKRSFDVFNGKHRYLIEFEVEALEEIEHEGRRVAAYKVKPTVSKLTDSEGENRLEYARIWISSNDKREVLKLESKVLVGKVTAKLTNFKPRPSIPKPVILAGKASIQTELYASVSDLPN